MANKHEFINLYHEYLFNSLQFLNLQSGQVSDILLQHNLFCMKLDLKSIHYMVVFPLIFS